jgi:hypothetical protein
MYKVEYSYIARGDTESVTGSMYCKADRAAQAYITARAVLSGQRKKGVIKAFSIRLITKEEV